MGGLKQKTEVIFFLKKFERVCVLKFSLFGASLFLFTSIKKAVFFYSNFLQHFFTAKLTVFFLIRKVLNSFFDAFLNVSKSLIVNKI